MSYAVLHLQKLKQPAIKGIQIHNQREKESQTNGDIDDSKSHLNYDLVNHADIDYHEKINKRIDEGVTTGKAIRKDAVRVASFLVTSDKAFFDELSEREEKRFFESSYEFFCEKYGDKNIVYSTVHKDEKTPHMHVGFVPITENGRLSAKEFFGQKRQLVQLQDAFHEYIKRAGFDLERGVSSDRKHVESAKYKALTFKEMESKAKEKYEQTMKDIQHIEDHTKSVENIESKKVLGLVGMKEKDYEMLVDHATNGVVYQLKATELENKLSVAEKEVEKLQSDIQRGQNKLRYYYKDIEENLDSLSTQKAKDKLNNVDIVKEYQEVVTKYNGLVKNYNVQQKEKVELKQKITDVTFENKVLRNENRELKGNLERISQEFSRFKSKIENVLHAQMDRVKSFLKMKKIDPKVMHDLDHKQDHFVQHSLKNMEQPTKQNEMELER